MESKNIDKEDIKSILEALFNSSKDAHQLSLMAHLNETIGEVSLYDALKGLDRIGLHYSFLKNDIIESKYDFNLEKEYKYIIHFLSSGDINNFLRKYIEENEGSPCSADKQSFAMRKLCIHALTGENQSLFDIYTDKHFTHDLEAQKKNLGKQTYWSPKNTKRYSRTYKPL